MDAFAGINGGFLQPAATVSTPYGWEVNLLNVGGGFSNDYAFVANASASSLLRDYRNETTATVTDGSQAFALGDEVYAYDFINRGKPHFGSFEVDVLGPALSLQLGDWTRIGVFTRLRAQGNARGVDADLSYYPYDALPNGSSFGLNPLSGAIASWAEYGLQFARAFPAGDDAEWQLGLNARYLQGLEGGYAFNSGGTTLTKINVDSVSLAGGVNEIAFTSALRDTDGAATPSGNGFGLDLGVQYAWETMREGGYRFSWGLSVLDIGGLTFNQGAELHRFSGEARPGFIISEDYNFVSGQEDLDEVLGILNEAFGQQRGESLVAREFSFGLPTAISTQFTYRPVGDLRLSAAYVGGLALAEPQLRAGQQLTLAAHFSKWWYGLGLTTNLHEWRYLNLGVQLRLGPLTFGTDRFLGTLARTRRFQAADFYFGFRLHDFGGRKKNKKDRRSRKRGKRVRCYQF